uniref:Bifunctional glutamine synthetase adenylyltransferase/adenylyl-removing enzyme n=1 Tax=uncultured Thiotrichaceae bacterium TaxID=298394 RepID=A0A6S6U9S5_9GAMM|nr:MAG: Glutamate-ammonia-ligase adenylyltransferase (EC [uncultured Thiotrichaceae bacterium]
MSIDEQTPPDFQQQLMTISAFSPYLSQQLERTPEYLQMLSGTSPYSEGELVKNIAAEIAAIDEEPELMRCARQIRHRETVRIAWRDLSGLAELPEVMRDVSDLADALVNSVLDWWHERLCLKLGTPHSRDGIPQRLLVLGMGKLGGRELNFSSDIDLIFAFPEAGETDGRKQLDNQTFFTRLGQKLINTLGQITADGFAYRVDMRLRPFGEVGALALSFDAMEHYYQTHGREWERYALIKARVMASDPQEGQALMQRLRPFVYRRYLDYGAVEQLRDMKIMINREAKRKGKQQDVKLGQGGIREIEFTAQVFQLMRGGRVHALQQTQLLNTLDVLQEQELLSAADTEQLREAYCYLRRTENRLQMWDDQQTHSLPSDEKQQQLLANSMGADNWPDFMRILDTYRQRVTAIFLQVFAVDDETDEHEALDILWSDQTDYEASLKLLEKQNFHPPEDTLQQLHALHTGRLYNSLTELARSRLDRLIPALLHASAQQNNPALAFSRALQVVQAIAQRSGYIAMLGDQPAALEQFVKLVHSSIWITTQLTQHPILLDNLLDTRQLYTPLNRQALGEALQQEMASIAPDDTGLVMERLRQFKLTQTLRVAAADISNMLPLMVVSDQLSWIAEAILDYAVQHVWTVMTEKTGIPCYEVDGEKHFADFGIVAYGKLGGIELGYSSDLDIIFIHDSTGKKQQTNGSKQMENPVFFARLARKIIHILSTFTHDGRLYEIDTRLRPSGASGLLVTGIESLAQYQREKAWVWEHQALLRSRIITGNQALRKRFEAMREDILCQPRNKNELRADVITMRQKMWQSPGSTDKQLINLKKDHGGITDIEFMVQYLILANAHEYPELVRWSDNIRQLESLQEFGLLSQGVADRLAETYRSLRNHTHELALQEEKALVPVEMFAGERGYVREYWAEIMGKD